MTRSPWESERHVSSLIMVDWLGLHTYTILAAVCVMILGYGNVSRQVKVGAFHGLRLES